MAGSIDTLRTTLTTLQRAQEVSTANVARYGTDAPRQHAELSLGTNGGVISGLMMTGTSSSFDEQLAQTMRNYQTKTAALQRRDDTYIQFENRILGRPGESTSFFHSLNNMADSFKMLATDGKSFLGTLSSIKGWAQDIIDAGNTIQNERHRADVDLNESVTTINQTLQNLASLNQRVAFAKNEEKSILIDQRRSMLHELSGHIGIQILEGPNNTIDVLTTSQIQLVTGNQAGQFIHSPASSVAANTIYNPVLYKNIGTTNGAWDATSFIAQSNGLMASLLDIRDTFLPNAQEQLDVIAKSTVDAFNAMHNQGTSLNAPSVMTGEALPNGDMVATTTGITGTGTVRIGTIDKLTGNITTSVDIDLSTLTTINDVLTSINGSITVSASITHGTLVLTSTNPNHGLVISHEEGTEQPKIGLTNTPSHTKGFSHFFGLNNLFSNTATTTLTGFSQTIKVRSDIESSRGQKIAIAYAKHPTTGNWSIGNRTTHLANDMSDIINQSSTTFPDTAELPSTTISIRNYSLAFLDRHIRSMQTNRDNTTNASSVLSGLSERAYNESGVDIQQEFLLMQKLAQDTDLVVSALALINKMLDNIIDKL